MAARGASRTLIGESGYQGTSERGYVFAVGCIRNSKVLECETPRTACDGRGASVQSRETRSRNGYTNRTERRAQRKKTAMLMTPLRCWRRRADCEPLHSIEALPEGQTPEEYEDEAFTPASFVCCGINHSGTRQIEQDCYRLCFKNHQCDEMSDNDIQDLTHILAVISQALAITATRMVNGGTVEVVTMQGDGASPM